MLRPVSILVCLAAFAAASPAQWHSVGNLDGHSQPAPAQILLKAGRAAVLLQSFAPGTVRVRLAPEGTFSTHPSWAVTASPQTGRAWEIRETPDHLLLDDGSVVVRIRRRPLRLSFENRNGTVMLADDPGKGMAWNDREVRVWKTMPDDESSIGFGEKAGRMHRRGTHMTMWNSDIPAYGADTDPLYQSIPFFIGIRNARAYGVFFDNSFWTSFDMGKESRSQFSFGAEDGELDYYFLAGPEPADVLRRFTDLVGRMPLPPLWSLGYQQCRWSYPDEARVRAVADGFRERNIPCDVIYLDIDYMEGYRIFTWNRRAFPDPPRLISDLRKQGFRTAVIVDPGIKADTAYHAYRTGLAGRHFLTYPDGRTYIGKVWPGPCAFPDFSRASSRAWWGENFRLLTDAGVRGWWNDMNEPSVFDVPTKTVDLAVIHDDEGCRTSHAQNHNLYGMQMTRATYDGVRALVPAERPFLLTRASFAGGHRYSAAWTGDNVASWEHLDMAVAMCLNLSVSGQPFVGSDIGGFIGYPGGELFARWLQFGVFTPLMRAHSVINEKDKEPWTYGEEYTAVNRETINLRYRLLPYLYTAMQEATESGIPPMRPLIFAYPGDAAIAGSDNEFLFGNDLLVAPVLQPGATMRTVRLPAGRWYDFWTNEPYAGGREVTVPAPLNRIPLFVREGAILPTRQVVQHTGEAPIDPLTFTVYPAAFQSTATYYEDDGLSFDYDGGGSFRRTVNQWHSSTGTTITFSAAKGTYRPPPRDVHLRLVDFSSPPQAVTLDGDPLPSSDPGALRKGSAGWWYDSRERTVTVQLTESPHLRRLHIN